MKLSEQKLLLREGAKIVEGLGKMLAPMVEVVLHDLSSPRASIIAIANNLSGRKIGDASTEIGLARAGDPAFPEILQNYSNHFPDGRPAKSTSIGLKDSQGNYVAAICLNMDISVLAAATSALTGFIDTGNAPAAIQESLAPRALEDVRLSLQRFAAARNATPRALTREQRYQAVRELAETGQLNLKNALSEVARTFGVARSTAYTYLPVRKKR